MLNLKPLLIVVAWAGPLFSPAVVMAAPPVGLAGDAARPLDLPIEGTETQPAFISRPTADDMSRFYPEFATALRLPGKTRLDCTVSSLGMLEACSTSDEIPVGMGFGKAALSLASIFRMRPRTVDGVAVGGGKFETIIRFAMRSEEVPESASPPLFPSPTPRAIALARRLSIAMFSTSKLADEADTVAKGFQAHFDGDPTGDPAALRARAIALDSIRKAFGARVSELTDSMAAVYAGNYSESQLEPIVRFMESPAGKAWYGQQGEVGNAIKRVFTINWILSRDDARLRMCQQITCSPPSPTAKSPQH